MTSQAARVESPENGFPNELRSRIEDEPPSVKLVAWVLLSREKMTKREVYQLSLLPERTVRYALKSLEELGVVRSRPCLQDARKSVYELDLENR